MIRLKPGMAVLLLALTLVIPLLAPAPRGAVAQTEERCFEETGFCISGRIREYWEQNGGLPVFGLPLTPQQELIGEDGQPRQAQWFERHRLELHPENAAPYDVLLGRVGFDLLVRQGRDPQGFPPFDPNSADAERCAFFAETNHQVCEPFLGAFRSNGLSFPDTPGISREESIALFGLPISEAITETIEGQAYSVQWFERARFELHPENAPPFNVLFGRLGAELSPPASGPATPSLEGGEWQLVAFGPADAPQAASATNPATLAFSGTQISGTTGCNGYGGEITAAATTITFGAIRGTLIACEDELITAQERALYAAFQGTRPYSITADGELRIGYDDGQQLSFRRFAAEAAVSGTITYLQRIALPPQAIIEVQLVDVSRADAPATVIAFTTLEADGRQVPLPFYLPYDPTQIDERNSYAVQARITIDGELRFITTERFAVITQGNPTTIEVRVDPV
jgi:uncharacterized lipoprotein YbaY/heat shock protein HslJ